MYDYRLIRSKRRSVSLNISREMEIIVRAPEKMLKRDIDSFVQRHAKWIDKHLALASQAAEAREKSKLSEDGRERLYQKAAEIVFLKVNFYSTQMNLRPTAIKITWALMRWGSCSAKNSICFSYRLALLPDELIEYIVVHELAHIAVKNHGPEFYNLVKRFVPDYKERETEIKELERALPY